MFKKHKNEIKRRNGKAIRAMMEQEYAWLKLDATLERIMKLLDKVDVQEKLDKKTRQVV